MPVPINIFIYCTANTFDKNRLRHVYYMYVNLTQSGNEKLQCTYIHICIARCIRDNLGWSLVILYMACHVV